MIDVIAGQAERRADEVAGWSQERAWPVGRLREAWVVWRYGATAAAEFGAGQAGPLEPDDPERLRRAAARYARHAAARPAGFPQRPLTALAQIAAVAGERGSRPQTLHYGIRVLDQLTRRMRAIDTARDPARREHQAARAAKRHQPPPPGPFDFRRGAGTGAWPAWVALDDHGDPILAGGHLQIADHPRWSPARDSEAYLQTLRDARLLDGLWPPQQADGRYLMAFRNQPGADLAAHATSGPYPPPDRPERRDYDIDELARRAGITHRQAQRVNPDIRARLLNQLRAEQHRREAAERAERWEQTYLAERRADDA